MKLAAGHIAPPIEVPATPAPVNIVELLFFAYRDFVGEPDRVLAQFAFGRAHHRVLHFVSRHPGLSVAALLTILGITKQSLSRVLRDLIDGAFIEQRPGEDDRRQRLLFVTPRGQELAATLLSMQEARVARALQSIDPSERRGVEQFLLALVDTGEQGLIAGLVSAGQRVGGEG